MQLQEVFVESIVVGGGPVASLVVLRTVPGEGPAAQLPIRIGSVEASAISMGVAREAGGRPMTHDLLASTIDALGGALRSVRVVGVEGTTFFAQLELERADGEAAFVDARPSDAIALAVRMGVPILASADVLEAASMPDFKRVELEEFHDFVETLSPDDFSSTE